MSLSVTIKSSGATLALPSDGDNGNQEIDTSKEAEAALSLLKDADDAVTVGDKTYTREQLVKIRDANQSASAAPSSNGASVGTGVSHGFALEGFYQGGLSRVGHSGPGFRAHYELGALVSNGGWRVTVNPSLGLRFGSAAMSFETPGGQVGHSSPTAIGGSLGVTLRAAPPVLNNRIWGLFGVKIDVSGFTTPASTAANLPITCTPDQFGRAECEPNAGPRTGNAGTTGLYNEQLGAARGTSGLALGVEAALGLGGDIARGAWGSIGVYAEFAPRFNYLSPGDGHAFGYVSLGGNLGVSVRFGGNAAEVAKSPEKAIEKSAVSEQPPAGEAWGVDDLLRSQLPAGAQVRGVSFDGNALSGPPYTVPAASMTAGSHVLRVAYRLPGDTEDRIRELAVTVAAPVVPPSDGGFVGIEHIENIDR